MFKLNTIRFKISVLYVVILGIILISYSVFLYMGLRIVLYSDIDQELQQKAREFGDIFEFYEKISGPNASFQKVLEKTITLENEGPEAGADSLTFPQVTWLKNIDQYDVRNDFIIFRNSSGTVLAETKK